MRTMFEPINTLVKKMLDKSRRECNPVTQMTKRHLVKSLQSSTINKCICKTFSYKSALQISQTRVDEGSNMKNKQKI